MACGCCHGADLVPLLRAPARDRSAVLVLHCRTCAALTAAWPSEVRDEVARQAAFHEYWWEGEDRAQLLEERDAMRGLLEFHAARHLVYDLGAGRANLLACLRAEGFQAIGCEPALALVARAREVYGLGPDVLAEATAEAFLDSRPDDEGSIDAIFLWHVLEHLTDPVSLLARLAKRLSPCGAILAQGPLLAPDYVYPEHLFFHTESNVNWLAAQAGLKPLLIEAQNPERFISFVLVHSDHPDEAVAPFFGSDPLDAAGALYFTLSSALRAETIRRESMATRA